MLNKPTNFFTKFSFNNQRHNFFLFFLQKHKNPIQIMIFRIVNFFLSIRYFYSNFYIIFVNFFHHFNDKKMFCNIFDFPDFRLYNEGSEKLLFFTRNIVSDLVSILSLEKSINIESLYRIKAIE